MSLITERYEYAKLTRKTIDGKRRYQTPVGNPVASVTTILGETADKSHLIAWRKRVGEQKAKEITTEAAGVGSRMHKYLEDYIETGSWPEPGSNPYAKQAHKMAEVIRENAVNHIDEMWGSEVALYVPNLYAGTTDLVGKFKNTPAIMDFKQSNKIKKGEWVEDYYLQMTAYAIAHNEVHDTDIQHGHIFMCTRALEYQQFDLSPEPDPYFGRTFKDWSNEWWNRVYSYYEANG
jgi:hypothetical protein